MRQRAHAHAALEPPLQDQQQQHHAQEIEEWLKWFGGDDSDDEADVADDAAAFEEYLGQHPPDLDAFIEQFQAMQQQ